MFSSSTVKPAQSSVRGSDIGIGTPPVTPRDEKDKKIACCSATWPHLIQCWRSRRFGSTRTVCFTYSHCRLPSLQFLSNIALNNLLRFKVPSTHTSSPSKNKRVNAKRIRWRQWLVAGRNPLPWKNWKWRLVHTSHEEQPSSLSFALSSWYARFLGSVHQLQGTNPFPSQVAGFAVLFLTGFATSVFQGDFVS